MQNVILIVLMLLVIAPTQAQSSKPQPNLLLNPDFEQAGRDNLPAQWEKIVIGAPAEFAIDAEEHHEGRHSVRISSSEVTRSYVQSSAIQVVPGEKIKASAWVKVQDVPEQMGTVILIGMFSRGDGSAPEAEKFATAKIPTTTQPIKGWQQIGGTVTVPDEMDLLRIRPGFSYSKGTCWWDEISVQALEPIVAKIDLDHGKLTPAMEPLPVTILNRTGDRGRVRLKVMLNNKPFTADVQLDGKPVQAITVPITIDRRGKAALELSLYRGSGAQPVFTRKTETSVPPPLVLDPPLPTHWVIEDGPPEVSGEVVLALKKQTQENATLTVTLLDDAGATRGTWSSEELRAGPMEYAIKAPQLTEGKYKIAAEVHPRGGEVIRAEQNWFIIPRRLAKVTINPDGWCEYDGKAIFPMGIFNSGMPAELAEAGFTLTHAYNAVRVFQGERGDDQKALEYLNETEKAGLKSLCMVPLAFATHGEWDKFRRRIRMFRNHPALLAWDEEEGLGRGDWNIKTLAEVRRILNEEDPNHPFMVGDPRDVVYRLKDRSDFFPLDQMDMGMWWWYPLPLEKKAKLDALEGTEVSGLELTPPTFLTQAKTNKPIWVGVQSYKKDKSRFPTPLEYRAQAYIAIAEGAKGLMWYGGYVHGGIFQEKNKQEGHWTELKTIVTELKSLDSVWVGKTEAKPMFAPAEAPMSVALKRGGGRLVLVAVNRGEKAVSVKVSSPLLRNGSARVIGEDRELRVAGGAIDDRFEPYVAHVYELAP